MIDDSSHIFSEAAPPASMPYPEQNEWLNRHYREIQVFWHDRFDNEILFRLWRANWQIFFSDDGVDLMSRVT